MSGEGVELPQNGLYGVGYKKVNKMGAFHKKGAMINVLKGKLSKNLIYKETQYDYVICTQCFVYKYK